MGGDVIPAILAILRDELHLEVADADADLLASGVLDSLALVDLLVRLETRVGVAISLERVELEDLRNVRGIAGLVERERASRSG